MEVHLSESQLFMRGLGRTRKLCSRNSNVRGLNAKQSQKNENAMEAEADARSARGTPLQGPPKPPRASASLNPFGSDFEDDDEDGEDFESSRRSQFRYGRICKDT